MSKIITDPYLAFYADLTKHDGASFMSDDAYGRICTVTGATWGMQGRTFNGTSDLISIPASNSLSPTDGSGVDQPFGIFAWIKPTDATNFIICSRGSSTTREYQFFINASDKLLIGLSDPAATVAITLSSDNALTAYENTFVHVAVLYTGSELSSGLSLLVNGVVVASTAADTGVYAGCTRSVDNFQLGKLWSNGSVYANGIIGELVMYMNRLPTPVEVQQHYFVTKGRC